MAMEPSVIQQMREFDDLGEPSFADIVHALTTPYSKQEWTLKTRFTFYAALIAYSFTHPLQFASWVNDVYGVAEILEDLKDLKDPYMRHQWAIFVEDRIRYSLTVAKLFVRAPLRCPREHARKAFLRRSVAPTAPPPPPKEGTIRVKWYPSVEATWKWPFHLGELWVDLPLGPNGSLDLRPALRLWGMENCHTLDANRGKPHISRYPVEELSALAVNVLLGDRHAVIGIMELPTPHMQDARMCRAFVKATLSQVWPFFSQTLPQLVCEATVALLDICWYWLVNLPFVLWFLLLSSPYILWNSAKVLLLLAFAVIVLIARGIQHVYRRTMLQPLSIRVSHLLAEMQETTSRITVQTMLTSHKWMVVALEALLLTEAEIREMEDGRRFATQLQIASDG